MSQKQLKLVNRANDSGSPYINAHSSNPIAWQLWSPETLKLARKQNRLLFVSIGYAACHWCHVMERDSFSSLEVAHLLNTHFIPVKVDREERPDLDAIYMSYIEATTGGGGWPLNVFLTPQLEPLFGGTYWSSPQGSKVPEMTDVPNFLDILTRMKHVWANQEERCRMDAQKNTQLLREYAEEGVHIQPPCEAKDGQVQGPELELLEEAYEYMAKCYDQIHGGLSLTPKFPVPFKLTFLLRLGQWPVAVKDIIGEEDCARATAMAVHTLSKMARGGIRDHIGNGFARSSITSDWTLPHFEKMLYDQAQLLDVYLDAFIVTRDLEMLEAVVDIATYLTSAPIAAKSGGFYSSEDADSLPSFTDKEPREGAYYVWSLRTIQKVLDPQSADVVAAYFGILIDGNVASQHDLHDDFAAQNVLHVVTTAAALGESVGLSTSQVERILREGKQNLRQYREKERPRPSLDDKIVAAWNGLAIGALARAGVALESATQQAKSWLAMATATASFVEKNLYDSGTGQLWRTWRDGRRGVPGLADDYAGMIHGLIELYEASFEERWLKWADELQEKQIDLFSCPIGGFFTSLEPSGPTDVLLRLKSGMDASTPSINSVSAMNLFRLSSLLNDERYTSLAKATLLAFEPELEQRPGMFPGLLASVVWSNCGGKAIILAGGDTVERGMINQRGLGLGTTLLRVRRKDDNWIKSRNAIAGQLSLGPGAEIHLYEHGVCKEVAAGQVW